MVFFYTIGALAILIPFWFINGVAKGLKLRSRLYYCGAALMIAVMYAGLLAEIGTGMHGWYTDPPDYRPPDFLFLFVRYCPTLAAAGLVGGYTYWRSVGRHMGKRHPGGTTRIDLSSL